MSKESKKFSQKSILEDTEELEYSVDLSSSDYDFFESEELEYSVDLSDDFSDSKDVSSEEESFMSTNENLLSDSSFSDDSMPDGLKPFDFEPICSAQECSSSDDGVLDEDDLDRSDENSPENQDNLEKENGPELDAKQRKGNTDWCLCGKCKAMETERESLCCLDTNEIPDDYFEGNCITESEGFESVCLSRHGLKAAIRAKKYYKEKNNPKKSKPDEPKKPITNVTFRYAGYRQFVFWVYDDLKKGERKIIPSCVVWSIRERFPKSENEKWTNYKQKGE